MSIIHDALKKTQDKLDKTNNRPVKNASPQISESKEPLRSTPPPAQPDQKPVVKLKPEPSPALTIKIIPLTVITSIIVGAIFIYFQFFIKTDSPGSSTPLVRRSSISLFRSTEKIERSSDAMVLNGTMTMGARKVALINNKIYEVGDFINGLEVLNITLEDVQMRNDSGITVLKKKK